MLNPKVFSSVLSRGQDGSQAVEEMAQKIKKDLQGKPCDLAIIFISENYQDPDSQALVRRFHELVSPRFLIGCNSSGVVGDEQEVEMEPAISAMAMSLPEIKIQSFSLSPREIENLASRTELIQSLDIYPTDQPKFICLADPMSCDVTKLLYLFNQGYGQSPVIGGLSSGVVVGIENWLALDQDVFAEGAVGLALSGDISFESVVSQGCRPIGEPLVITKAEGNVLYEVAGTPVLETLGALYEKLSARDRALAKHSLFVGIVMDESRQQFTRGDFLIRNIMDVDYEKGNLVIGEMLQPGQTLQFQIRDAKTAEEDLQHLLAGLQEKQGSLARGAILVSCCGRGKELFKETNHDVRIIQALKGPVPLTGFFANGEFGPIDRKNYIHGYTSSLTIVT